MGRAHWLRAEGRVPDQSRNNKERTTEGKATQGGWGGTSSGTARINTHTTRKYEEPTRTDASNATEEYTRSDTVQNIHYGGNYRPPESLPSASSPIATSLSTYIIAANTTIACAFAPTAATTTTTIAQCHSISVGERIIAATWARDDITPSASIGSFINFSTFTRILNNIPCDGFIAAIRRQRCCVCAIAAVVLGERI